MADTQETESTSGLVDVRVDTLVRVALLGLGLGVAAWGLAMLLNKFAVMPLFCHNQPRAGVCADPQDSAGDIALVLTAVAGVLGLVRLGIYRPMLVAIAVAVCVWGLFGWLDGIVWYESLGWAALIFTAAYALFTWLVRPRNFVLALAILVVVIGLARYAVSL